MAGTPAHAVKDLEEWPSPAISAFELSTDCPHEERIYWVGTSHVQPGDWIAVPKGGKVPLAIRQDGSY